MNLWIPARRRVKAGQGQSSAAPGLSDVGQKDAATQAHRQAHCESAAKDWKFYGENPAGIESRLVDERKAMRATRTTEQQRGAKPAG